ncbi:MAG: DUF6776 family protein [Pseudomonadota bacterium]
MSKLVIKKHKPLELFLYCLALSALTALLIWFLLDNNHWQVIQNQLTGGYKTKELWQENRSLIEDNQQLQDKVIKLERLTKLDEKTAMELQLEIKTLQDKIYELTAELEFYEGIMTSANSAKGLNIQGLIIEATEVQNFYRFKLILTNVAKSDNIIKVLFDMSIEGLDGSGSQVYNISELSPSDAINQEIKFNNFERIEGSFSFPEGFRPVRVVVDLNLTNTNTPVVQRSFQWADVAG